MTRIHIAKLLAVSILLTGHAATAEMAFIMPPEGYVVVEAEDLSSNGTWAFQTARKGYTGRGYVKSTRSAGTGHGIHTDCELQYQSSPDSRLNVPVYIPERGSYTIDLRNTHEKEDGDNDCWIHVLNYEDKCPLKIYDHHVKTWAWLTSWGHKVVRYSFQNPGIYTFYVAPRSSGFGIDRIAIMKFIGPNGMVPAAARETSTPAAEMQEVNASVGIGRIAPSAAAGRTTASLRASTSGILRFSGLQSDDRVRAVSLLGRSILDRNINMSHAPTMRSIAGGTAVFRIENSSGRSTTQRAVAVP